MFSSTCTVPWAEYCVERAGPRVHPSPDLADDARAEPLGQVAPEDPDAVVVAGVGLGEVGVLVVERQPREVRAERADPQVLAVVVDRVVDLVLDPAGRAFHEPEVLEEVVAVLDRVEELVCDGDLQRPLAVRGAAELGAREVVVDHAVRGDVAARSAGRIVGRAVAVEPDRSDVGDIHVELPVRAVVLRPPVGLRRAVAHLPDLDLPHVARHLARRVDPVGHAVAVPVLQARRVARLGDPEDTDLHTALVACLRPVLADRVERARRPGEQTARDGAIRIRQPVEPRDEVTEDDRRLVALGRLDVAEHEAGTDGLGDRAHPLEGVLRLGDPPGLERLGDPVVPGLDPRELRLERLRSLRSRGADAGARERGEEDPEGPLRPSPERVGMHDEKDAAFRGACSHGTPGFADSPAEEKEPLPTLYARLHRTRIEPRRPPRDDRARRRAARRRARRSRSSRCRRCARPSPWGTSTSRAFLNGAVAVDTELLPRGLLAAAGPDRARARACARRRPRYGPRTMDLDLLLYGERDGRRAGPDGSASAPAERRFALEPLVELDPVAHAARRDTARTSSGLCWPELESELCRTSTSSTSSRPISSSA